MSRQLTKDWRQTCHPQVAPNSLRVCLSARNTDSYDEWRASMGEPSSRYARVCGIPVSSIDVEAGGWLFRQSDVRVGDHRSNYTLRRRIARASCKQLGCQGRLTRHNSLTSSRSCTACGPVNDTNHVVRHKPLHYNPPEGFLDN